MWNLSHRILCIKAFGSGGGAGAPNFPPGCFSDVLSDKAKENVWVNKCNQELIIVSPFLLGDIILWRSQTA